MGIKMSLLPLATATLFGFTIAMGTVQANPFDNIVTSCEPFQPYPGVTHQKCTRYHYDDDGALLFTSVYYIDENGVWYLTSD